jgi:hypothetical protein
MRHLLLWLLACVLISSVATAESAWVDPDIIKAYEKVTGKNFADEVAKLIGVKPPSSGIIASPRIDSDSSKSNALRSNERIRGIVRRTAEETLIGCTIVFVGDTTALARLGQRIDFRVNDSTGFITFPADLLPVLSVLEGMRELYLGGAQEFYKPDRATLIDGGAKTEDRDSDSGTTHQSSGSLTAPKDTKRADSKPAWVDPDIITAYEKVTGKSFAEEVAKLTGANSTPSSASNGGDYSGQGKTEAAEEFNYRSVPGVVEHNDGIYLHVHLKFDGDVHELESLDPRIYVNRMGDKISRAGNVITVRFPIELLPKISCLGGVRKVYSSKLLGPQLNYSTPRVKGYYANVDSTHYVSGSDVKICRPQNYP